MCVYLVDAAFGPVFARFDCVFWLLCVCVLCCLLGVGVVVVVGLVFALLFACLVV